MNQLILPLVLWDNKPPNCQISSMMINDSEKYIFTGTTSGHIIIWEFKTNEITPLNLLIGHTGKVNCLAKAGITKDEEFVVSSSENGEMKLWEINEQKCVENIRMSNTVHKNIYSSKLKGKHTRLFCIGNYTDVLVMDPMSLDILYTLVSREQHQWINALCINTLANKQDEVIVGVSVSGTIKLWTVNANEQKGSEIVEHEYKNCLCENAYTLTSCPGKQRIFIVVCPKFFQIFDAFDFTVLCQIRINSIPAEDQNESVVFINGFFLDIDTILICASNGYAYLYLLPDSVNPQSANFRKQQSVHSESEKSVSTRLVCKFTTNNSNSKRNTNIDYHGTPVFSLYEKRKINNENKVESTKYLIRGDWDGQISVWDLDFLITAAALKETDYQMSLKKYWKENVKQDIENFGFISTFLYLSAIDRIVYGTNDGTIIILPAIDFLIKNLFQISDENNSNIIKLKKHTAKITCILYPHSENPRYDKSYLVTGSADFSVILWNINSGEMIHRFVVQAGEILQLSVPPPNVNPRILQCVCSISCDHSVALLSLKECKPVMVASNHLFPITLVKWRPLDDYLLVKCSDGGVFVWQIETGSLDRVAHGLLAEDILLSTDEISSLTQPIDDKSQISQALSSLTGPVNTLSSHSNSSLTYASPIIISNKSISNQTIALSHILHKRSFTNSIKGVNQRSPINRKKTQAVVDSSSINYPLVMQTFQLSPKDPVNHLLLFDIDSLLTTLILEEQSIDSIVKSLKNTYLRDNFQRNEDMGSMKRITSTKLFESVDIKQLNNLKTKLNYAQSITKLTNILLSSLHVWALDQDLDTLFSEKLCIYKPNSPVIFGRISRGAHLFVSFPSKVTHTESGMNLPEEKLSSELTAPSKEYWLSSKFVATEHLLAILSISNSFMNLSNFINLQLKNEYSNYDPLEFILGEQVSQQNPLLNNQIKTSDAQSTLIQTYSRLSNMYSMLNEYYKNDPQTMNSKIVNLETLALKWMDPSYEIRESAQLLLKNELKRIGTQGRASLIKTWEPHLTSLLKEFDDLNQLSVQQSTLSQATLSNQNVSSNTSTTTSLTDQKSSSEKGLELENSGQELRLNRIRRKQYVAIILLSLIGAEFGQDINTNTNKKGTPFNTIPQGFSLEDHSILKRISTALSNLVTNKNLEYDVTRRAAIDLIGRGFTVWEPFIQPTFVLLTLLELSADAELYVPKLSINLPLTPIADTCRISRNSISIIANSKPKTFILTIAKEIKRINASSSQGVQNTPLNYSYGVALTRGKPEILKIIENLIDNQFQDVFELLSDVIEIILFCIDMNLIRNTNMEEIFPPIFRFPMVRYCKETKRIVCGCHNGRLVMYEFKTSKWHFQSYPAHNNHPIVAVAISADFKYVASYSAHDNSLIFWQSTGGSLFSLGSNTLKLLKACSAAPIKLTVPCNKLALLSWQNKTLNLSFHDNRRFSYQI